MLMILRSGFGAKITPQPFQSQLFQLQARKRRNRGLFQALSAQKRTILARLLQDARILPLRSGGVMRGHEARVSFERALGGLSSKKRHLDESSAANPCETPFFCAPARFKGA